MTKEQAIERLKIKLDNDKKYLEQCNPFGDLVNEVRLDNKAIETVLYMLEEKDKIIDLMAERLKYYNGMQQKQEFCIDICEEKECNIEKCKERIKQYFENKAKERR